MPITITVQIEERARKLLVEMAGKQTGPVTENEGLMANAMKRALDQAQEAMAKTMGKTLAAQIDLLKNRE